MGLGEDRQAGASHLLTARISYNCSMSTTIELTRGMVALVDEADFPWLNKMSWRASPNGRGYWQAVTGVKCIKMYSLIMRPPPGLMVDHINGDTLDNRRSNLRVCTSAQNRRNSRKKKVGAHSKYKGVYNNAGLWRARIRVDGRSLNLGNHATEELAALAYDRAAQKHYGEFACLNFPDGMDTKVDKLRREIGASKG